MTAGTTAQELADFRAEVKEWCAAHVPTDWRSTQTQASDEQFVTFQQEWFQTLRHAGYAVPHWPAHYEGGMSVPRQVVLYQELAAHDAPRLVLSFVAIHHAAATILAAGTAEQQHTYLPAILEGQLWAQAFSEPGAGSDLAALGTTARRKGESYRLNGQKVWASGAQYADWCLLLARTDPDAPKREGISYFLLDMRTPGIDVRPIRQATGESHFCEIFLDNVEISPQQLIGTENNGWQLAQETLSAERGLTMLELAERLGNTGFKQLVAACAQLGADGRRGLDEPALLDRLAELETEISGLRRLCQNLVDDHERGNAGPAAASIVKLLYSELLQKTTDIAAEIGGVGAHTVLRKPMSASWEYGASVLDFVGSWEWTIPGGASEIQRTIIAQRGLGLPRERILK